MTDKNNELPHSKLRGIRPAKKTGAPVKIVFMGTAKFAVHTLEKLIDSDHLVELVVTQPDRRKGRGMGVLQSTVKEAALKAGIKVFQPENVNSDDAIGKLRSIAPDVIVVVAYGQILKSDVLNIPESGCINVHASLLPELRGAAPINRAIVNGDKITGVTTMLLDEGMDTGDILLKSELEIGDDTDAVELAEKLSTAGGELLIRTIEAMRRGDLKSEKQDESKATYARRIKKSDGEVSFAEKDAREIHNMVRGFTPWPGAYTAYNGKTVKLTKTSCDMDADVSSDRPGTVVLVTKESVYIAAKRGLLEVKSLQPQNKRAMDAKDFINGYGIKAGAFFGGV